MCEQERTTTERMRSTWDTERWRGLWRLCDERRAAKRSSVCPCERAHARFLSFVYSSCSSSSRTSRRRAARKKDDRERGEQERGRTTEWRAWSVVRRRCRVYWFLWVRAAVDGRSVVVRIALRRVVRSCRPQWFVVAAVEFTCGTGAHRCVRAWPAFYSFVFGPVVVRPLPKGEDGCNNDGAGRRGGGIGCDERVTSEAARRRLARNASTARRRLCNGGCGDAMFSFRRASLIYLFLLLPVHCKTFHRPLVIFDRSTRFWDPCTVVSHHNTIRRTVSSPSRSSLFVQVTLKSNDFFGFIKSLDEAS